MDTKFDLIFLGFVMGTFAGTIAVFMTESEFKKIKYSITNQISNGVLREDNYLVTEVKNEYNVLWEKKSVYESDIELKELISKHNNEAKNIIKIIKSAN